MSIEGSIAVIKRVIRGEEILLKECKSRLINTSQTITSLEQSLEDDKKKLEALLNEARKGGLQQDSGSGGEDPPG